MTADVTEADAKLSESEAALHEAAADLPPDTHPAVVADVSRAAWLLRRARARLAKELAAAG
jgi:hypothetical protein